MSRGSVVGKPAENHVIYARSDWRWVEEGVYHIYIYIRKRWREREKESFA